MCNCKARSKISSSNNNLGRAVMIRRDMRLLNLRPPGRCLELLAKEDAARAKIATRKRNPDVRQKEAKRRMDAKLADELETLKSDLNGDAYFKGKDKILFEQLAATDNLYVQESLIRTAANTTELAKKRTKHAKSFANAAGDWGIVCHYCLQVLSDRTKTSATMLPHSALKAKLQTHRKGKNCSKMQQTFTIPPLRMRRNFFALGR